MVWNRELTRGQGTCQAAMVETQRHENRVQLADYRAHYRADADAIIDPEELSPQRRASEYRRLQTLVRLLHLHSGERVLDIGCGSGWLAALCSRSGARVRAMDIALHGVAGAKSRFPEVDSYQVGDIYHLCFESSSFDAVVLSEVVEHLEDIPGALAEVRRVLQPAGRVLVSVPYRETIVQHLCIHCNHLTPANAHLHSFDEDILGSFLAGQDLVPERFLLVNNKLLELGSFPHLSRRLPYWCWRWTDLFFNRTVGRPAFICMLATRSG